MILDENSGESRSVVIGIDQRVPEGDETRMAVYDSGGKIPNHFNDWPWMIVLDLEPGEIEKLPRFSEIGDFRLSIRRMEDGRLFADMSNEPTDFPTMCVEVLHRTRIIVRYAGPEGSDSKHLYLWDAEKYRQVTVKDLQPDVDDDSPVKYDIADLLVPLSEGEYPQ